MLSVCLMTQDYQMFFTYKQFLHSYFTFNSSITFLFSFTFLPISFCHHHFSTSISLDLSLPLVCPFIHLIGCLTCKQNNANKIRERELLMLQSRNRKESHTQTLTHREFEHGPNRQVYLKMMNADWTYTSASVLVPEMISERRCSSLFGRLPPSFHVFMCVWC